MSLRTTILDEIQRVANEHNKKLADLEDEAPLLSLGLDSLCFAILVFRLQEILEVDPFNADGDVQFPSTLGELIQAYEEATPLQV
jgi:acyl carrier protein